LSDFQVILSYIGEPRYKVARREGGKEADLVDKLVHINVASYYEFIFYCSSHAAEVGKSSYLKVIRV
jgi:hypothetical protein